MPIYEYRCSSCGEVTEKIQRLSDPPLVECPTCGGELSKLISAPAIQFKGTGWYVTDYADKGSKGDSGKSSKSKSSSGEGGSSEANKGEGSSTKKESSSAPKKSAASDS